MLTATQKYSKQEYERALEIVIEYEDFQNKLKKIKGRSECPFCGGTKVKPFVRAFRSQDCTDCDKNGTISNQVLYQLDLLDFIKK